MRYSSRNFYLLTGLGVALGLAAGLLRDADGGFGVAAVGFAALLLLSLAAAGLSYGAMDDIQKQNLKSDWYWGTVIGLGLLFGLVLPFVIFGAGAEHLLGFTKLQATPRGYFLCGVAASLMLMGAGYFSVALFRRLRWLMP